MFAGVVVNQKTEALNRIFHYIIPPELDIKLGMIVEVSFGRQKLEAIVVELVGQVDFPVEKLKPIAKIINPTPLFGQDLLTLSKYISDYYLANWVSVLQGMLPAGMHLTGKMPKANIVRRVYKLGLIKPEVRGEKQALALAHIFDYDGILLTQLLEDFGITMAVVRGLEKKGLIEIREETVWADHNPSEVLPRPQLTAAQVAALGQIRANFAQDKKPVLLYGVTGSGKTEIYLQLAEEFLQAGKQVIILVPEIALTPQTVRVFQGRLGAAVAVLHSNLTGSERRKAWQGIAEAKYQVVIGARSAIFAPTPNLGLIIIDEEHETSYKQDNAPRFHTRNVALERCRLTDAKLVMGSATPDLETYYKAQKGDFVLVELPNRIGGRDLAKIDVVDMREELKRGNNTIFSQLLQEKLLANFEAGKQSMLFLNRRGYESFVSCRSCGFVVECPHCSVAMSYHLGDQSLKCHYCGQNVEPPTLCPKCGSSAIRYFGAGTQKIAEAVKKLLPEARIARIDRDSVQVRGSYEKIYRQMLNGEIDILVGTQMIAKGLDFANVTLVGVVAADTTLNLPDYRSGERTFQLITQVAGRAGRHQAGEVVVQTYKPESKVLYAIKKQDFGLFYQDEILQREFACYPPFTSLIRLVISGTEEAKVASQARELGAYIGEAVRGLGYEDARDADPVYWGPKPCPKAKIKDRYRLQIMVKARDLAEGRLVVQKALANFAGAIKGHKEVQIAVDVEPINMV